MYIFMINDGLRDAAHNKAAVKASGLMLVFGVLGGSGGGG
jgi:hypothetical protein